MVLGATGGLVFDYYSATDYKFAAIVAGSNKVVIGHVTATGTIIDASVAKTIAAGTTYQLGISLSGSTVSVTLNGPTRSATVISVSSMTARSVCSIRAAARLSIT